jgi:hypothetical protein
VKTNERFLTTDSLFERWEWYQNLGFNYLIESEINLETTGGLVSMMLELYDEKFITFSLKRAGVFFVLLFLLIAYYERGDIMPAQKRKKPVLTEKDTSNTIQSINLKRKK